MAPDDIKEKANKEGKTSVIDVTQFVFLRFLVRVFCLILILLLFRVSLFLKLLKRRSRPVFFTFSYYPVQFWLYICVRRNIYILFDLDPGFENAFVVLNSFD